MLSQPTQRTHEVPAVPRAGACEAVAIATAQRPQFRDPRGRVVAAVPAQPMVPDLGWPMIRAANEALAIDADTIACEWDGTPMRCGIVIDQLIVVDGLA
jgi:hypothetical protein